MKYAEIEGVYRSLTELAKMTLPVGYAIAKNHRMAERIIKEADTIRVEECEKRATRDSEGNILYVIRHKDTGEILGEPTATKDDPIPEGYFRGYYVTEEADKELVGIAAEIMDEDHDVQWHTIDESKIEGCNVPGGLLLPLLFAGIIKEGA